MAALRPSKAELAARHRADDPDELDDIDLLEHVCLGTAPERLVQQILVQKRREDHDVGIRPALEDLAAQLEPVRVVVGAQLEVEQDMSGLARSSARSASLRPLASATTDMSGSSSRIDRSPRRTIA